MQPSIEDIRKWAIDLRKNLNKVEVDLMQEVITSQTYVAVDEIDRVISEIESSC